MNDKVVPSSKSASNGGGPPSFPATKAQLYGATTRNAYRPQPTRRRHSRGCCCSCCLWTTIAVLVLVLVLLAGIAGVVFYVLYSPHRPTFSVTALKLSYLNATSSAINSKFNLTVTARNPNKKLIYIYNPTAVKILAAGVDVGDGIFQAFEHRARNTTVLRSTIASNSNSQPPPESDSIDKLKAALKAKNGVPLKVRLYTKVRVKVGGVKTPRIGIRVTCDGIRVVVPAAGKAAAAASTSKAKCKVETRVKIWRWTF